MNNYLTFSLGLKPISINLSTFAFKSACKASHKTQGLPGTFSKNSLTRLMKLNDFNKNVI